MTKFHELYIKTELLPLQLGKILNETFELRQFSDYDVDAEISEDDAKNVLNNARMFMDTVRTYLHNADTDKK